MNSFSSACRAAIYAAAFETLATTVRRPVKMALSSKHRSAWALEAGSNIRSPCKIDGRRSAAAMSQSAKVASRYHYHAKQEVVGPVAGHAGLPLTRFSTRSEAAAGSEGQGRCFAEL